MAYLHLTNAASETPALGAPSVTVTTGTSTVKGSLLVNTATNTITFVRTSSILATGSYTVTFRSAATGGFVDLSGGTLAGDANGVVLGTNYVRTMSISTPATTPTLTIPSFARGPNSAAQVVVPNTASAATTGIPIVLTNAAANLTTATFTLNYNPAILNITGTLNSGGDTFTLMSNNTATGTATFQATGMTGSGTITLGQIVADVPNSSASIYKSKSVLDLSNIVLSGSGYTGAATAYNADGVDVDAYFGDVSGDGLVTAGDAGLVSRVQTNTDTGFAAYPLLDPIIIGGVDGNPTITTGDATLINQFASGQLVSRIPSTPTGLSLVTTGVDPSLSIPTDLTATAGGTVVVPVNIDNADPTGSSGLTEARLALTYDPAEFSVTAADVHLGSVPASGSGWQVTAEVDPATGQIAIDLYSTTPITNTAGGSLVTIDFHTLGTAAAGATPINLAASVDPSGTEVFQTELADNQGLLTLHAALTNAGCEPGGGRPGDGDGGAGGAAVADADASGTDGLAGHGAAGGGSGRRRGQHRGGGGRRGHAGGDVHRRPCRAGRGGRQRRDGRCGSGPRRRHGDPRRGGSRAGAGRQSGGGAAGVPAGRSGRGGDGAGGQPAGGSDRAGGGRSGPRQHLQHAYAGGAGQHGRGSGAGRSGAGRRAGRAPVQPAPGNVATGFSGTVTLSTSDTAGRLDTTAYTFTTAGTVPNGTAPDDGAHAFNGMLIKVATQAITAVDATNSLTGGESGIVVSPAAAASFVLSGYTATTVTGAGHTFTVTAEDAFGNLATEYTGTVKLTSSDLAATFANTTNTVSVTTYTFTSGGSGDNGVHTFSATFNTPSLTQTSLGHRHGPRRHRRQRHHRGPGPGGHVVHGDRHRLHGHVQQGLERGVSAPDHCRLQTPALGTRR